MCSLFNIEFGSLQLSPFENTSIEKIFDRFKNRFSKVFEEELKTINRLEYVDDEFEEIYRWIGVDIPAEGDDEDCSSDSRVKQKAVEDAVVGFGFSSPSLCLRVDDQLWVFFSDTENDEQVEDQAASESQTRQRWAVTQL